MYLMKKYTLIVLLISLWSCHSIKNKNTSANLVKNSTQTNTSIKGLRFIGEQVIPSDNLFKNTKVGGLSSVDYVAGKYYVISDDRKKSIRFYEMDLTYDKNSFSNVTITNVTTIENDTKGLDPESLRLDKNTNHFFWSSEGFAKKGVSPTIFEIDRNGNAIKTHQTPPIFQAKYHTKDIGTRRNGTFEGLSMSVNPDYYWVGMELPLKQDGEEPQLYEGKYPIRISKINKKTDELVYQFAYMLDKIPRNSIPKNKFLVNGCPEILEISETQFLFIERAYASGHKDGGNTIKIYLVDFSKATNIYKTKALKNQEYIAAEKTLLFNFESLRPKLTNGIIDNIEGITFGKNLANGNKSLVLVSDNNFNKFGKQLSQFIVLEVLE